MPPPVTVASNRTAGRNAAIIAAAVAIAAPLLNLHESSGREHLMPYRDPVGIWTVCDGITGPDVIPGKRWTKQQCKDRVNLELTKAAIGIDGCVYRELTVNQLAALTHFAYNVGVYAACGSTVIRLVNAGDMYGAAMSFAAWNKATTTVYVNGSPKKVKVTLPGLVNRRKDESTLFLNPDPVLY